jgi:hypothetical protein
MARLTKRDREELRGALRSLERGLDYLNREEVRVARVTRMQSLNVYRNDMHDPPLAVIDKTYGSDLTGLEDARDRLAAFLTSH